MITIKCKMCGGNLNLIDGLHIAECEYCGTKQTVPVPENEKKAQLFERANNLRSNCEFDMAAGVYETIVQEYPDEAEGYWGLVLCKYGVEYVDDPATGKKIPTCHRLSFENVMDDINCEFAIRKSKENAEAEDIYIEEAKKIESIRSKILETSNKEAPYDIFISYKETDINGNRTKDSVIAQEIYDELVKNGYRVFFSRISLESKIGQNYEPYIFSALNSAKIMLVVGTSSDNINAAWVKNEWTRYLELIKRDSSKVLIPCYQGMDAYDLPKEFVHLQAQDLGKIGAVQDLVRGITKIMSKGNEQSVSDVINNALRNENKKRRTRGAIIFGTACVAVTVALAFGIKSLVTLIKNNKSETNNYIYQTQAPEQVTTQSKTNNVSKTNNAPKTNNSAKANLTASFSMLTELPYASIRTSGSKKIGQISLSNMTYKITERWEYNSTVFCDVFFDVTVDYDNSGKDVYTSSVIYMYVYDEKGNVVDKGMANYKSTNSQIIFKQICVPAGHNYKIELSAG